MSENNETKWPSGGIDRGVVERIIEKFEGPSVERLDEEMKGRVSKAVARLARLRRLRKSDPELADLIEEL